VCFSTGEIQVGAFGIIFVACTRISEAIDLAGSSLKCLQLET
jgi:hypothetical protein